MQDKAYTPALGRRWLTPAYDAAVALATRERRWRNDLAAQIAPQPDESILDVGCGTGTLAIRLKLAEPLCRIVGLDPDPEVLDRARAKARAAGVDIEWRRGFLTAGLVRDLAPFDVAVTSLVLHQTPLPVKAEILKSMHDVLAPDGRLFVADYALQRSRLMRALFRLSVQAIDGVADTQANADGCLPQLIERAGFASVDETAVIATPTGSISILTSRRSG